MATGEQASSMGAARARVDPLPPGPPLPELVQLASWLYRPFPFLSRCRARYGHTFSLRFFPGVRIVEIGRASCRERVS
jgi:hypothetical protein